MVDILGVLENQILSGQPYETQHDFVTIDDDVAISTITCGSGQSSDGERASAPVVCLHGMGGACAMWLHNIVSMAPYRQFYAIDLPGFGRSSRCDFSQDSTAIEEEFVNYIELWRQQMKLDKFVLMGHSFGGYLASLYTLKYPERVHHLLLVDPWGYVSRPTDEWLRNRLGSFGFFIFTKVAPMFSPFTFARLLGEKYGPWMLSKARKDLMDKFSHENADKTTVSRYLHHCNAQIPASGEEAFAKLTNGLFWAKHPLLLRIFELEKEVPMTFVYGEESWNTAAVAYMVKQLRSVSYVDVQVLPDAGHHLYADQAAHFNDIVKTVCQLVDEGKWSRSRQN